MQQGNLVVGQSGGCTAVINQSLAGIITAAQRARRIRRIFGMRNGIFGCLKNDLVDLTRLNPVQLRQLRATPSSALGSCRYKITEADCEQIFTFLHKRAIRYFILIGGNDSAITSQHIAHYARTRGYELSVIAVPKTIDNDLPCMDHTPGYGSAATFIAGTTQEAGRDTEAMRLVDPVKIIEVMGRNAGWLVAAAALGKRSAKDAPHLLYFPERPFSEEQFIEDVDAVYRRIGYVVVVVSETIRDKDNRRIGARSGAFARDHFGHQYVEGTAARLRDLVEEKLHIRARFDKPGTLLRMSMRYASPSDQREAFLAGKAAVRLALKGMTEGMVTLERASQQPYRCTTGWAALSEIAGREKIMPDAFITPEANFVTPRFIRYARPLVGDLPDFIRL